jgi:hypothetical protein
MFLLSHVMDESFDNTIGMYMPSDNNVTCLYVNWKMVVTMAVKP